jgi:hypothetical protein
MRCIFSLVIFLLEDISCSDRCEVPIHEEVISELCLLFERICRASNRLVLFLGMTSPWWHIHLTGSRDGHHTCWLPLDAALLYALKLVHALLVFLNQTIYVVLKLTDFSKLCVETHLKFWIRFVEVLFAILLRHIRPYWHHLDVKTPWVRKFSLFAENNSRTARVRIVIPRCFLEFPIILKNNLNLSIVANFYRTLIRFADFFCVRLSDKRSYLVRTKLEADCFLLFDLFWWVNWLGLFLAPPRFLSFFSLLVFKQIDPWMSICMTGRWFHNLVTIFYHNFELVKFGAMVALVKK